MDMDSEQKYTEDNKLVIRGDSEFFDELQLYSDDEIKSILYLLVSNYEDFPDSDKELNSVCGVIKGEVDFYFEVFYAKEPNETPIYVEITNISLDDYLDSINYNKALIEKISSN